jgi:putative aldouronate transport system substrate-binding protein
MSDEGQVLNNWGLEGVHYDVIDGRRVFRPEEREAMEEDPEYGTRTGIGLLSAPFPTYADGLKDASGQYYTLSSPQDVIAGYNSADREVLEAYGVTRFAELFAQPEDFPIRPWPKEGSVVNRLSQDDRVIFQRLQDTIKRDVIAAIVGPEDQFDANWEKFENNMRQAGLEQFEEAVEELIAETLELWEMED